MTQLVTCITCRLSRLVEMAIYHLVAVLATFCTGGPRPSWLAVSQVFGSILLSVEHFPWIHFFIQKLAIIIMVASGNFLSHVINCLHIVTGNRCNLNLTSSKFSALDNKASIRLRTSSHYPLLPSYSDPPGLV